MSVRAVVGKCKECQSIDPPPMHWLKSKLDISNTWYQVGMDITHYQGRHYLLLIDSGPTRFSVWRHLRWQYVASIIDHLEVKEHSLSTEMLADSDTAFCSNPFRVFMNEWGVSGFAVSMSLLVMASQNGVIRL